MMKKTIALAIFVSCASAMFFCPPAFAEEAKKDINTLLPKDTALVVGVDVYGLTHSDAYNILRDRVLKNVPDFDTFERFFTWAGLKPYAKSVKGEETKEVVEEGLAEIILVKRSLDASTDNTSALLIGVFKSSPLARITKQLPPQLKDKVTVTVTDEGGRKIYEFKGVFRQDETLYAVELKDRSVAVALTKQEALDYVGRDTAAPETATTPAEEIVNGIKAVRPGATIWGVAYITDERRKQFAASADQDETMLQFVKSVSLKMEFTRAEETTKPEQPTEPEKFKGADIAIDCAYAPSQAGDFLETALTTLRDKAVKAFDDAVIKDLFNGDTTISKSADSSMVDIRIKADKKACEGLVEQFANLLGVEKPKPAETTPAAETAPAPEEGGATPPPATPPTPAEGGTAP